MLEASKVHSASATMSQKRTPLNTDDVDVELATNEQERLDENGNFLPDDTIGPRSDEDTEVLNKFYREFDYVMVFPMKGEGQIPFNKKDKETSEQSNCARFVINTMLHAHFNVYTFLSVQGDELYALFSVPEDRILNFAYEAKFRFLLDSAYVKKELARGLAKYRIKPIKIADETRFSYMHPFDHLHGRYNIHADRNIYTAFDDGEERDQDGTSANDTGPKCILSSLDRLKLTYSMLTASKRIGGCKLDIQTLLLKGEILALYPMHKEKQRKKIYKEVWKGFRMPWNMPFELIRQYMGEKIALFFVFIGFQTWWVLIPAFIGFCAQIVVWSTGPNYSHPILPFFAIFTSFWTITYLNFWRRNEAKLAMEWGMTGFEDHELDRPQFRGDLITSPIDGKFELWYPPQKKRVKMLISQTSISLFILLAVAATSGIYVMSAALQPKYGGQAATIASIVNAIQINVFNIAFLAISTQLNDSENHKTDTQYADSLISKNFSFQFVNSYNSFFYLAFIAQFLENTSNPSYQGQCGYHNCMQPLAKNLAILYGTRITSDNIIQITMDWFAYRKKLWAETHGSQANVTDLSPPEQEYALLGSDTLNDSINLFADAAIQFGFIVLFIVALPIAFLATLLSNFIRLRLSAWKMTYWSQRPVPVGCEDIGSWTEVFYFVAILGTITNAALICVTMDTLKFETETMELLTPVEIR